jgi:hypothetical protein
MTMIHSFTPSITPIATEQNRRCGASMLELLVAFTLLTTALSLCVPLIYQHGKLLTSARQYRLAVDELANQAERLQAIPAGQVRQALSELQPSPFTAEHLPGAAVTGELTDEDVGSRLTLSIVWSEPQRSAAPVRLTAWIAPTADDADDEEASPSNTEEGNR